MAFKLSDLDRELLAGVFLPPHVEVDPVTGCWEWQTPIDRAGYGVLMGRGAHRVSYAFHVGPIEDGMHIDHLCRNRRCVCPVHLEPVTPTENLRRAMAYVQKYPGERVHQASRRWCVNGHRLDEANTGRDRRGSRYCKQCHADWAAGKRRARGQALRAVEWYVDPEVFAASEANPEAGEPTYLTPAAAEYLGISRQSMAGWMRRHPEYLPEGTVPNKRRRWPQSHLDRLLAARRPRPPNRRGGRTYEMRAKERQKDAD